MSRLIKYNILVVEDQRDTIQLFSRRFENHEVAIGDVVYCTKLILRRDMIRNTESKKMN